LAVLLQPQYRLLQEAIADKYIGFSIDSKKTVAFFWTIDLGEAARKLELLRQI
jgi:hypothetical protein